MATPWTPNDDHQLADLHAAGLSLTVCARRMGRNPGVLSRKAKALGLPWDRSATAAATSAKVADNRARRAELEAGLLADAAQLRAELFAPCKVFNFGGKDNTYEERAVEQPLFIDQKNIMQAVSIAVTGSLRIAVHDSDASHDDAKSMLGSLMRGLRIAYDEGAEPPTPETGP